MCQELGLESILDEDTVAKFALRVPGARLLVEKTAETARYNTFLDFSVPLILCSKKLCLEYKFRASVDWSTSSPDLSVTASVTAGGVSAVAAEEEETRARMARQLKAAMALGNLAVAAWDAKMLWDKAKQVRFQE